MVFSVGILGLVIIPILRDTVMNVESVNSLSYSFLKLSSM